MRRIALIWFLVAAAAWSQAPDFSLEGVRRAWYVVPTGADIAFTSVPWKLVLGGGLEQPHFGRALDTGDSRPQSSPYTKPLLAGANAALYYGWSFDWADAWLGPSVVGYKVWSGTAQAFPDWSGNAFWAIDAGLKRDRLTFNEHGLVSGYRAQATAQWSPNLLSLKGTDFYRLSLQSDLFIPLWDMPGDAQLFSGVLALRADAQYTGGSQVPIVRLDATEVRGYDSTFDARALTVGTAELRVRLPSWWKSHDVVPVGFGFVDVGSYAGFADVTSGRTRSGVLAGLGIGGGLELFGKATPTLTLGVPLLGVKTSLWWDLSFHLAF